MITIKQAKKWYGKLTCWCNTRNPLWYDLFKPCYYCQNIQNFMFGMDKK